MGQTEPAEQERASPPAALPPEVEAELRRRAQAAGAPFAPQPPSAEASQPEPAAPGAPVTPAPAWTHRLGPLGLFLIALIGIIKNLSLLAKFAVPVLKMGGTMLLSIAVSAQLFGWRFGAGIVLCILVHELGHVFAAWRLGVPVTAPVFLPGFGAYVVLKERVKRAADQGVISIAGPIAGALAGLACLLIHQRTGSRLMEALTFTGCMLNLLNLAPFFPLDGFWATRAASPSIWLLGWIALIGLYAAGPLRNPLLLLLMLISIPRLWHALRTGGSDLEGMTPPTAGQRLCLGLAYIATCAALAGLGTITDPNR